MKPAIRRLRTLACLLALGMLLSCNGSVLYRVKTETIVIDSISDIQPLRDSLVKPVLYTNVSGLERLSLPQAKQQFIFAILPSILVAKHEAENRRRKIMHLLQNPDWTSNDSVFIANMKAIYREKDVKKLSTKIVTIPNSVILAQAAIETGWGQSRFFVKASNLFGIWSYDETESRIEAGSRKETKIFVRSYDNMSQSISDYLEVLSRHRAYGSLRKAQLTTKDPYRLVDHLKNYSERRKWYVRQLKQVIRQNNLTQYDAYRLDPQYFSSSIF